MPTNTGSPNRQTNSSNFKKRKRRRLRNKSANGPRNSTASRPRNRIDVKSAKIALSTLIGWPAVAVESQSKPEIKSSEPPKPVEPPKPASPPREPQDLIELGNSSFNLKVLLTTRGGAVQQVILTKFDAADRLGREVKQKDENGKPTKKGVPLYLIPGEKQIRGKYLEEEYLPPTLNPGKVKIEDEHTLAEPSYNLFHYASQPPTTSTPILTSVKRTGSSLRTNIPTRATIRLSSRPNLAIPTM